MLEFEATILDQKYYIIASLIFSKHNLFDYKLIEVYPNTSDQTILDTIYDILHDRDL